ncbi:MAG: PAS domain S-box protein [Burkholderiales bacterium]|nr:PAS domain S-box protein [Burkholderiales bacterium]
MYAESPEDTALHPLPRPPLQRAVDARRDVRRHIPGYFFGTVALASGLGALLFAQAPGAPGRGERLSVSIGFLLLMLLALGAKRLRGVWIERSMFGLLALATVGIAASAWLFGWGLDAPGIGFYGLFACVTCAAVSRRMGLAMAGLAVGAACALELAMRLAPRAAPVVAPPDALRFIVTLMLIAAGLASGMVLSYVVGRYTRSADDREQRFRGLLAIAADAYWEIDDDYALIAGVSQRADAFALGLDDGLGRRAWDLPQFHCEPEALDLLIADLDRRLPFRDRLIHWQAHDGAWLSLEASGEPRFDERGVFLGYWGVLRDVSSELAARRALEATETRYQELFARIPTPLVLHREGRIIDANPAAIGLLGYENLAGLHGRDLLAAYESGDSRERERRRIDDLSHQPAGAALAVADFHLLPRQGPRVSVRATGVRVDAAGGPATLSIYVDDTERRAAEEALRRSETMLSHLVATSPDLILLADLATGRCAMVNKTFERVSGWSAVEVVGKTMAEFGLWLDPAERERFIERVRNQGPVADLATVFIGRGGHQASVLVSGARFLLDRRHYLVINARDVTEAERGRLEREAILQNASIGIAATRERRFVIVNPRFEQMFGWAPGTLDGRPAREVWPSDEAYAEIGAATGGPLARGESCDIERAMQRRDGSTFMARIRTKAIDPNRPEQGGTIWIVEDVTERHRFEQELAAARDAAEDASRAKSAFLANTSHELRTPLNGLLHLAQMAREPGLAEERRQQYLDQVVESARTLAEIITDILDLSKIEAGKLGLESTRFDLGELLHGLQRTYATLAAARGLAIELETGPGVAGVVVGDPLRVRQVLNNFLSNALKFTAAGHVRLAARRSGAERVRFEVSDTGPGIDSETQARLFTPFTQADDSTTRRFGGTGLGLSICRELALLMGGEVGVDSGPGRGSVFWAELPLPAHGNPAPSPPALPFDAALQGRRVLMVEDNAVNMMIAVALLERWGIAVDQAVDGREAINAVLRAAEVGLPYDAVLMDVQMPEMSGYQATRELRKRSAGQGLPIIALTAAALVGERETALEAGMDDFLTKPIDAERLREALLRWVKRG